jgi:hypothetical protein
MIVSSGMVISIGEPGKARLQMGVVVRVWVGGGTGVEVRVRVSVATVKVGKGEVFEAVSVALAFSVRPVENDSSELAAVEVKASASIRLGRLHAARVVARARHITEGESLIMASSFYRIFIPWVGIDLASDQALSYPILIYIFGL